ncbi:MAG: XdhC family protein [Acidiferrobacterales bacterium]|nr:XdhC family protein [Acidiferrobacterales bacterium]
MKTTILHEVINAGSDRQAVALVTNLEDNTQALFFRHTLTGTTSLELAISDAFRRDQSRVVEVDGDRQFIQVYNSPLRLLIVGAVHIAKPLVDMGQSCGYDVTLIDPRRAFASETRFPGVNLSHEWPDQAMRNLGLDSRTAVVTLTHDPKLDEPALIEALESEVFYVGALGSRKTHAERCDRLTQSGITSSQIDRIHAPVGLDIAAQSPAEIAVSIIAEITHKLRKAQSQ